MSWPLPDELDDARLEAALYPPTPPSRVRRPEAGLDAGAPGAGPGPEVLQGELRGVVEGLAGRLAERGLLVNDPDGVKRGLHVEDGLLGGFEDRVKTAEDGHRKDDVAVLAADVDIAERSSAMPQM